MVSRGQGQSAEERRRDSEASKTRFSLGRPSTTPYTRTTLFSSMCCELSNLLLERINMVSTVMLK